MKTIAIPSILFLLVSTLDAAPLSKRQLPPQCYSKTSGFFIPPQAVTGLNAPGYCLSFDSSLADITNQNVMLVSSLVTRCLGSHKRVRIQSWDTNSFGTNSLVLHNGITGTAGTISTSGSEPIYVLCKARQTGAIPMLPTVSPAATTTATASQAVNTLPLTPVNTLPVAPVDTLPDTPENDTSAPAVNTLPVAPVDDTATPVDDTAAPVDDTTAPVDDTTAPVDDTTAPTANTLPVAPVNTLPDAPENNANAPAVNTLPVAPVDNATTPVNDTTVPGNNAITPAVNDNGVSNEMVANSFQDKNGKFQNFLLHLLQYTQILVHHSSSIQLFSIQGSIKYSWNENEIF